MARVAIAAVVLASACARASGSSRVSASANGTIAESCPVASRAPALVRLDDRRPVYVEPMTIARAGASYVLAGEPVYLWKARGQGENAALDSSDAFIGIVGRDAAGVRGLPRPPIPALGDGLVSNVRIVPDGADYAAVFAVTAPRPRGGQDPAFRSYWFARTDGTAWRALEQLPQPQGRPVNTVRATAIVRAGQELMLAALTGNDMEGEVVVYSRAASGAWRVELVPARGAYVALGVTPSNQPALYVVRPDTLNLPDANSVSLFTRAAGGWRDQGVVVRGGQRPVHHPVASLVGDMPLLTWVQSDDVTRDRSAKAARILPDGRLGPAITIGRGVQDVVPVYGTPVPRWVVKGGVQDKPTLSLVEWDGVAQPVIRDVVADPFAGFVLAHAHGSVATAIGPVMNTSPGEEVVVSGVVRFDLRCRTTAGNN